MNFSKIKEGYHQRRLLYNLIILSALFFVNCFWGNGMWLAFPVLALFVIFDNLKNGLSYIAYSIPFCFLNVFTSSILFFVCAFLFLAKFFFIKYVKEKQKPNIFALVCVLVFFVYCLIPIGEYNLSKIIHICLFACVILFLCVLVQKPETFQLHFNVKILAVGLLVSALFGATYSFNPYLQSYLEIATSDGIMRFMALCYHPNVFAMICELDMAFLLFYMLKGCAKVWDYVLFALLGVVALFTLSKTYLFVLAFMLFVILIWRLRVDFKKTAITFCALVLLAVALCLIFPQIVSVWFNRFFGGIENCQTIEDFLNIFTTTRFNQWVEYSQYLAENPLAIVFGAGLGAPILSVYSPHNAYLAAVYEIGVVGVLLFALAVVAVFKSGKRKLSWQAFVPFAVMALIFMSEDLIFYIFM